jgi:hypothetical protein
VTLDAAKLAGRPLMATARDLFGNESEPSGAATLP